MTFTDICAYVANMQATPIPPAALRISVIDPTASVHVMEHTARGFRWSVPELPPIRGCSIGTLSHLRTGPRRDVSRGLAAAIHGGARSGHQRSLNPLVAKESDNLRRCDHGEDRNRDGPAHLSEVAQYLRASEHPKVASPKTRRRRR